MYLKNLRSMGGLVVNYLEFLLDGMGLLVALLQDFQIRLHRLPIAGGLHQEGLRRFRALLERLQLVGELIPLLLDATQLHLVFRSCVFLL